jgi:hypothetical protein
MGKFLLSFIICILSLLVLFYCSNKENILRFTKGVTPIQYSLEKDSILHRETGERLEDSASCQSCHKEIYKNWMSSRHKQAFTNPLYQASHEKEPMVWCLNCHTALIKEGGDPKNLQDRIQSNDGVSCITCHVRNKKILTSKIPNEPDLFHSYTEVPNYAGSEFCANCHQFNFLTQESLSESKPVEYSQAPMQNTYEEWKSSPYYPKKTCQSCHLFPNTKRSHSFSGGHSVEDLEDSFRVEIVRMAKTASVFKIETNQIGHSFPTGDLFRSLRFRILDESGSMLKEWIFQKKFSVPAELDPKGPSRILIEDSSFSMEEGRKKTLEKNLLWNHEPNQKVIYYEFYMDYQSGMTHLFSNIPTSTTLRKFKSGKFILPEWTEGEG